MGWDGRLKVGRIVREASGGLTPTGAPGYQIRRRMALQFLVVVYAVKRRKAVVLGPYVVVWDLLQHNDSEGV